MTALQQVCTQYKELLWAVPPQPGDPFAALIPGQWENTLCWPDLDYTDMTRSDWHWRFHYRRILQGMRLSGRERFEREETFRQTALAAIRFWLVQAPLNPNWWHNEIGSPDAFSDLALMLDLHSLSLTATERQVWETVMAEGALPHRPSMTDWTGANLIWGMKNTLKYALYTRDEELLRTAISYIEGEAAVHEAEGIRPDGSFTQHGNRLYSWGYGRSFTVDMADIVYALRGTSYQLAPASMEALMHHVLDGQRYMCFGSSADWAAVGREICRVGELKTNGLLLPLEKLARVPETGRQQELLTFAHDIRTGAHSLRGLKYFADAHMMTQHTDSWYLSVKGHGPNIFGAEKCNSEGELMVNCTHGGHLCLIARGDEYIDLDPVVDFSRIPGITCISETDAQLLAHGDWEIRKHPGCSSCGKTEGRRGAMVLKTDAMGVSLTQSWFFWEGGAACLAADIRGPEVMHTTLQQCRANAAAEDLGDIVRFDGIDLHNLDEQTVFSPSVTEVTGAWSRNNLCASHDPITETVFTLEIPCRPEEHDAYAYAITPAGECPCQVLRNDGGMQAIQLPDGTVMAACHTDSALTLDGGQVQGQKGELLLSVRPAPALHGQITVRQAGVAEMRSLWYFQYTTEFFCRNIREGNCQFWCIERNGRIIGELYAFLSLRDERLADGRTKAYLCAFRIEEAFRGRGLGSRLMQAVLAALKQQGFTTVTLGVEEAETENRAMYAHMGFDRELFRSELDPCTVDANGNPKSNPPIIFLEKAL